MKNKLLKFYIFILPLIPITFAIDFGESLPLFTFSRIVLILLILLELLKSKGKIVIFNNKALRMIVVGYFLTLGITNLINFSTTSTMGIINVFLEQIITIYIVVKNFKEEDLDSYLKIVTRVSFIMAILGIVEFTTGFNMYSLLEITTRENLRSVSSYYSRMGVNRVEASFGHALGYGLYLVLFIPIVYMYGQLTASKNEKIKVNLTVFLMITNLFLTLSRSSILVFIIELFLYYVMSNRETKSKGMIFSFFLVIVLGITVSIPELKDVKLVSTINDSITSVVDVIFGTNITSTFDTQDNSNPYIYRLYLIKYTFTQQKISQLFLGRGIGFLRFGGLILDIPEFYKTHGKLLTVSIDNFYILNVLQSGVFSIVGLCISFVIVLKQSYQVIKLNTKSSLFAKGFFIGFIGYIIHLGMCDELGTLKIALIPFSIMIVIYNEHFGKKNTLREVKKYVKN